MSEDPFYAPNRAPAPPRTPTPARHVWSLWKDGARIDCDLRIQGEYGVVVDLVRDGTSYFAQRVPTYTSAEQLAAHARSARARGLARSRSMISVG
jgi:hypothetical protein